MTTNDVPGRSFRGSFNHQSKTGTITVSYEDLRRSTLTNTLEAQEQVIRDFASGAPEGTVFASKLVRGGAKKPVWTYEVTASQ